MGVTLLWHGDRFSYFRFCPWLALCRSLGVWGCGASFVLAKKWSVMGGHWTIWSICNAWSFCLAWWMEILQWLNWVLDVIALYHLTHGFKFSSLISLLLSCHTCHLGHSAPIKPCHWSAHCGCLGWYPLLSILLANCEGMVSPWCPWCQSHLSRKENSVYPLYESSWAQSIFGWSMLQLKFWVTRECVIEIGQTIVLALVCKDTVTTLTTLYVALIIIHN